MVQFINKFIKGKFKTYLVIMDNSGVHKSNLVKEAINDTNNILLYSVPYRPKTNTIESWFNQFKYYFQLKKENISYGDLIKKVRITIKKIPKHLI